MPQKSQLIKYTILYNFLTINEVLHYLNNNNNKILHLGMYNVDRRHPLQCHLEPSLTFCTRDPPILPRSFFHNNQLGT